MQIWVTNGFVLTSSVLTKKVYCIAQVYARKLGQCLLDIATNTNRTAAEANLRQYTIESNVLLLCLAMANPKSFSSFHGLRLDGVTGEGNSHLSDAFYTEMLVCFCSFM